MYGIVCVCVSTASKLRFQTRSAGAFKSVVGRYGGGRHAEHQSFPHLLRVRLGYNVGHRCVRKGLPSPVRLDVLWTQRSTPSPSDQVALCEIRMGLSLYSIGSPLPSSALAHCRRHSRRAKRLRVLGYVLPRVSYVFILFLKLERPFGF